MTKAKGSFRMTLTKGYLRMTKAKGSFRMTLTKGSEVQGKIRITESSV